jgi:molybdate transport system ATP-binding protein
MREGLTVQVQQEVPFPLDAHLDCRAGETVGLVGPSGSGKTTLLRCIAGLHHPPHGRVSCAGQTWLDTATGRRLEPQQRRVGMVFQHYALFPHLTALENVRLALDHVPRAQRNVCARELLARVHLSGLEERRPAHLSGGQQQRVALARALAREPKVLLLDEPFSAVDQVTRRRLRLELAGLTHTLHIPIVLVTHDLDEACMLARRLFVIHAGHTLQDGPSEEVLKRPASALVAHLMDVRNVFDGKVIEQDTTRGITRLRWGSRTLETLYQRPFAIGKQVSWTIPPDAVLLHPKDRLSRGNQENPIEGQVTEMLTLGGMTQVLLAIEGGDTLHMDLPPHVVKRHGVRMGDTVRVSLLAEALHLMSS